MDLLSQLKKLVTEERRITTELLKLLARAEEEMLYAERGYSSLFEFCVKELKYSEGAAVRRVGAMRLMNDHARVEGMLRSGGLSMTVACRLAFAFKSADIPLKQQAEIIAAVEGLTMQEVQKLLASILPAIQSPKAELKHMGENRNLLKLVVDDELLKKLDSLKAKFSHIKPDMKYRDLLEVLVNKVLKRKKRRGNSSGEAVRYVSPSLREKIWERDGGYCTYLDPESGRRCGSTYFLELDHIIPVAHGGRATEENLRLLCRTHNKLAARHAGFTYEARTNPN